MSSERDRLPFEPEKKRQPPPKKSPASSQDSENSSSQSVRSPSKSDVSLSAIPEAVNKRMVRRMALFCGIPTASGVASFFVFYWIVVNDWFKLPTTAVLLVSMGLFGLGVLGLSYGIISTSWDEQRVGSLLGWEEFTQNLGRLRAAWRSARQEPRGNGED
ncbi:MAG: DUF3464 domain-containing protein [Cyanobacteria bacterium QS_7_48_42]|jgi:hypothetical protein|nr:MAG: DUF3464 domain-containing protein [Cyanobacteria bacterium QH_1_48_107]PSO54077.1 MAG: DUF3464 domain-containing protein [Cyanobacteria bacterium QH_10_48_56]PSO59878.1 MAG: DUF3464 domain-containing protein [Cyanobacteria bacterium QH_2_48_84]PSO68472.1 MAG: DUF3464 domain-containing protein [Cyanobacteria bacterium QS_1_48_34]PSO73351.1 MAG: DUF3464 domain-containing protein [Cyanobacteria bacterium QH_3_48_40]PSO79339.1 MAG: DUF3464 domain-containing protein [Cyanobacteria bacterium